MWLGTWGLAVTRNPQRGRSLQRNVQYPKGKKSLGPAPEAAIFKGADGTGTLAAAGPVILKVK